MTPTKLSVRLFGPFDAWFLDGQKVRITNKKMRAMIALLICAPEGRRSRTSLRTLLWPRAYDEERGNSSLRQCLSGFRSVLGDASKTILDDKDRSCIKLNLELIDVVGSPKDGVFLEGLDLPELREFEDWLREKRDDEAIKSERAHAGEAASPVITADERVAPTLCVLPFLPLQACQENILLGDMLAEEVARTLSRSHFATVKSHFSCRSINSTKVDLHDLKSTLKADYAVCGAVVKHADRFRLKVDLIDLASGDFVWSCDFSDNLNDFFCGNSCVAAEIASTVSKSILRKSLEVVSSTPLPDTASHSLFISAVYLLHKQDIASSARSRSYLEELLRRAPKNSIVHSWLGLWYVLCLSQGWHENVDLDTSRAKDCTARALDLNPACSFSLAVDGILEGNVLKNFDLARKRFEASLNLDPNNAYALLFSGVSHAFQGTHATAVSQTCRSRLLSPLDPGAYLFDTLSATAELSAEHYSEALLLSERSYKSNPMHNSTLRVRTIALHGLGRMEEAKISAKELAHREPNLTIDGYLATHPAAQFETGRKWASALCEAGIRRS